MLRLSSMSVDRCLPEIFYRNQLALLFFLFFFFGFQAGDSLSHSTRGVVFSVFFVFVFDP